MSLYCRHNRVAGRCPDCPTATELTRQDLSGQLSQLFIIFGMSGLTMKRIKPWDGLPKTYEQYVRRLYGDQPWDPFMALNYGLLASIIVLIVALTWLILSG